MTATFEKSDKTANNRDIAIQDTRLPGGIRICGVAFLSKKRSTLGKGRPINPFLPWTHLWADLAMITSFLPSFIKIHQAVLERKSKMRKVYGRRTQ